MAQLPKTGDSENPRWQAGPHGPPAPRTSEGKPDLSGLWQPKRNLYWLHVNQDILNESALMPAAEAVIRKRVLDEAIRI
jgi:hypothetical protein